MICGVQADPVQLPWYITSPQTSGVGVRLKVGGGINIEKIEGVGYGEGLCPPQLGVRGLAPRKKIILR